MKTRRERSSEGKRKAQGIIRSPQQPETTAAELREGSQSSDPVLTTSFLKNECVRPNLKGREIQIWNLIHRREARLCLLFYF